MGGLTQIDHSRPMSPDVSAVRARRRVSQPGGHVTPRIWARRVSIFRLSAPGSRSNTAYQPVCTLGTDCKRMGIDVRFPPAHSEFIARCHDAGQTRPTPLLLQYGAGDYNCLHQDLYGEHVFPLQVAVLLSRPAEDFDGGEFVLTEQRPRMQSRVEVVPLTQGDAVVFAVNSRPVRGTRGDYRVHLRHGVSTMRRGHRHTLGIIFHDAT